MGAMSLRFAGPLAARFGTKQALVTSLVLIGAGLLLFARTPVHGSYLADVMPAMILVGVGAGMGFPVLMTLAMSGATPSDSGIASGLVNTTVQVGGAVGLAVLATFAAERTDTLKAHGQAAASALNSGYHLAYVIGAVLVAAAIAIAVVVLRPDAQPAADGQEAAVIGAEPAFAD
jgi:MFS family permease